MPTPAARHGIRMWRPYPPYVLPTDACAPVPTANVCFNLPKQITLATVFVIRPITHIKSDQISRGWNATQPAHLHTTAHIILHRVPPAWGALAIGV